MRCHIVSVEEVAQQIRSFNFKPAKNFDYQAGQFIELGLPGRTEKHWFTLSSSPTENNLSITTKLMPDYSSEFKHVLWEKQIGDEVIISEPMGDFVLPKDRSIPLVFIAAGIGITPFRSIIKSLIDLQEQRIIHLIYAAKTIDEVAFRDVFHAYGLPTDIVLTKPPKKWPGLSGRLTSELILDIEPDVDRKQYYIAGPEPLVENLTKDLIQHGVDSRRVISDYFPNYRSI